MSETFQPIPENLPNPVSPQISPEILSPAEATAESQARGASRMCSVAKKNITGIHEDASKLSDSLKLYNLTKDIVDGQNVFGGDLQTLGLLSTARNSIYEYFTKDPMKALDMFLASSTKCVDLSNTSCQKLAEISGNFPNNGRIAILERTANQDLEFTRKTGEEVSKLIDGMKRDYELHRRNTWLPGITFFSDVVKPEERE